MLPPIGKKKQNINRKMVSSLMLLYRSYAYRQRFSSRVYNQAMKRLFSCISVVLKSKTSDTMPVVGFLSDGNTVVCWYPEPKFPYEHTRPLPKREKELSRGNSVLKVQHIQDELTKYRSDGPTDKELANIFHTSKHRWYPTEKKYEKPNPPKDRDGL